MVHDKRHYFLAQFSIPFHMLTLITPKECIGCRFSFFRSSDGNTLLVASTDGFCSVVNFKEGEIGEVYDENAPVANQAVKQTKGKAVLQVGSPNMGFLFH